MTKIEWTDVTWNPVVGCSVLSPGCTNCYAMKMAARLELMSATQFPHYAGLTMHSKAGPVWTGKSALAPDGILTKPLTWKRQRMVFVCSMADLFHDSVPDEWIDRVFAIMAMCPQHTFQVLTKRSARMRTYLSSDAWYARAAYYIGAGVGVSNAAIHAVEGLTARQLTMAPLPNVWLGVSAERQKEANERIPNLLATPAAVRFVSAEPLLGPIDFTHLSHAAHPNGYVNALRFNECRLDWVIVGGESGSGARPMHPEWALSIRDQCAATGVNFFFKQWGAWRQAEATDDSDADVLHLYPDGEIVRAGWSNLLNGELMARVGKKAAGRLLEGREWNEMPAPSGPSS